MMFELLLDVMARACETPTLNAPITPYPTGRLFWGGAVPGTLCQATIAPSLRDISQQALARCCCEMSASVSRRDNTDRSLARSAWESVPPKEPSRRVRSDRAQLLPEV